MCGDVGTNPLTFFGRLVNPNRIGSQIMIIGLSPLTFRRPCKTELRPMQICLLFSQEGQVSKWRIENSWGKDSGHDGYITMTTEWFKEWVFEVCYLF